MSLGISATDCDACLKEGCELQAQGRFAEALVRFEAAVRLAPHELQTLIQLGFLLIQMKEWRRAAETYERIVGLLPKDHRVWCNLSYLYEHAGDLSAAEDRARKAIRSGPNSGEAWNNLGMALRSQHRLSEALQAFRQAVAKQPSLALAEFNFATTCLLMGDGDRGWPGYESRSRLPEARLRVSTAARWNGTALSAGKLLVYADQGLGDTLQFARFLPMVKLRSQTTVVLSCPPELLPVLAGIEGADEVVPLSDEPTDAAAEIPVSSLPGLFRVDLKASCGPQAYLPSRTFELRPPLARLLSDIPPDKLRVGLVWQGNPTQGHDYVRSVALSRLLPLAEVAGPAWISLQVNDAGRAQLSDVKSRWDLLDAGAHLTDFGDTAAVLQHLDLVITVDTALAHLAGALGRSVWTMLCHTPDWRWGLNLESSRWYPNMRLFRQPRWGDWDHIVAEMKQALYFERRRPN